MREVGDISGLNKTALKLNQKKKKTLSFFYSIEELRAE